MSSKIEHIILVDEQDNPIGTAEKLAAHELNQLHRAFSIFIYRYQHSELEILLQQRALSKYHSPGLWTNSCCSHPNPGETVLVAANRRLSQEFGFTVPLQQLGWFHYNAYFPNGLSENEIDHVLIGELTDESLIKPNPDEIHTYQWIKPATLQTQLAADPARFTPWLSQALALALQALRGK